MTEFDVFLMTLVAIAFYALIIKSTPKRKIREHNLSKIRQEVENYKKYLKKHHPNIKSVLNECTNRWILSVTNNETDHTEGYYFDFESLYCSDKKEDAAIEREFNYQFNEALKYIQRSEEI